MSGELPGYLLHCFKRTLSGMELFDLRGSSFSSYRLNGAQLLDVTMQWSSFLALVLLTLSASVVLTSVGM